MPIQPFNLSKVTEKGNKINQTVDDVEKTKQEKWCETFSEA